MGSQTPSIPSDIPHLNTGFDAEMDQYLDLDQNGASSSAPSPDTRSKSSAGQSSAGSNFGSNQMQQTFSGPSFQYDSHKQQTGLPVGGLANTFALNQATGMQYNGYSNGFIMPMETLNVPLTPLDEFDFAAYPSMDMDPEAESPTENMLYPNASSSRGQFVNPNVLLGQESAASSSSAPVQRMYPGMHTQLAAQAKAQQVQKQSTTGQQSRPQGQRPLPQTSKPQLAKDPHVEESISRLLNQMRQSSVTSVDDDASSPSDNLPHLARLKKDEDEMDEDERLLASEEGKKLSSKERRQLRNKVSARAFRSRRKEYIGQLEGEVAIKTQEANDLKVQNRQLMDENTRLTDLTRMLLSSQAFSGFLNELSGTSAPTPADAHQQSHSQSQSRSLPKDVNPHQATRQLQNQPQIRMTTVPESTVDFSLVENTTSASSWNAGVGLNFPVYSVLNVPHGPALDVEELSGKVNAARPLSALGASKQDMPVVNHPAPFLTTTEDAKSMCFQPSNPHLDLDEAAFALYAKPSSTAPKVSGSVALGRHYSVPTKCTNPDVGVVVRCPNKDISATAALELACSRLDVIAERIAAVTSHLT